MMKDSINKRLDALEQVIIESNMEQPVIVIIFEDNRDETVAYRTPSSTQEWLKLPDESQEAFKQRCIDDIKSNS